MSIILDRPLPGCVIFKAFSADDDRGSFHKPFSSSWGADFANFAAKECYYSISHKGVLRGMHLQIGSAAHEKIVFCVNGKILDVVLDLRTGPNFGVSAACQLSAENSHAILIPPGVAHGFLALSDSATVGYLTTTTHTPTLDTGVRWDSFNFKWPPVKYVSERDGSLPSLEEFLRQLN